MLPILVVVSLGTIFCLAAVVSHLPKMRKIISEPSLAAYLIRKQSPSLSRLRKNSSSLSVKGSRRGSRSRGSGSRTPISDFAGNTEITESRKGVGLLIVKDVCEDQ